MFDDPRKKLDWLNRELLAEEEEGDDFETVDELFEELGLDHEEDELGPGYNYAVDFGRTIFDDEEDPGEDMVYVEAPRKKGMRGLRYLAFLEILGILAVIGWWLKWLI